MNSHQRRIRIRRLHMDLPLGKEVELLQNVWPFLTTPLTVFRHTPRQAPHRVDLRYKTAKGDHVIDVPLSNVRLKNPDDRAPRPWWASMPRKPARGTA